MVCVSADEVSPLQLARLADFAGFCRIDYRDARMGKSGALYVVCALAGRRAHRHLYRKRRPHPLIKVPPGQSERGSATAGRRPKGTAMS